MRGLHALWGTIPAAAILLAALALYINGAVFSLIGSRQIDFSINYTAGRLLHHSGNIYDRELLRAEAERSGSLTIPSAYQELFATYIQPPPTAIVMYVFAFFDYETARLLYLAFNHILCLTAFGIILTTLPRQTRWLWYLAGIAMLVANYGALYMSFSLGQVDGIILVGLATAIWAWKRNLPSVTGAAIVVAAAVKLVPGLLLLYFLWKRAYRVLVGAAVSAVVIGVASVLIVGPSNILGYVHEVVPLLLKGSVHHQNVTLSAFFHRFYLRGEWLASLSEIPENPTARALTLLTSVLLLAAIAFLTRGEADRDRRFDPEIGLVTGAAILLSSIAWEFYLTWLLPAYLLLVHPKNWPQARFGRVAYLGGLLLAYLALSVPIGYLSEPNAVFYHPAWLPGTYLESAHLHLYRDLDRQIIIPLLRFTGLLLFTGTLAIRLLTLKRVVRTQVSQPAAAGIVTEVR